jgi:hypothetical protein
MESPVNMLLAVAAALGSTKLGSEPFL